MKNQPALKTALLLIIGIFIGSRFHVDFQTLSFCTFVLAVFSIILYFLNKYRLILNLFLTLLIGLTGNLLYQQSVHMLPPNHISHFLDLENPITLKGILTKDPIQKPNRTEWIVETQSVVFNDTTLSVCGKILIQDNQRDSSKIEYGDEIMVQGSLTEPPFRRNPGGYDYKTYLNQRGIYGLLRLSHKRFIQSTGKNFGHPFFKKVIYPIRRFAIETIDQTTSGESRAMLRALLIGDRTDLSPETWESFARAGIIHILAVSGLHVGFVIVIFMTLFGLFRLPYSFRAVLTIFVLILFTLITETRPPVVRASVMGSTYLLGTIIHRRTNPFNIIGFAALIILIIDPKDLFNIGFQLSFLAVFSILYFYQKFQEMSPIQKGFQWVAFRPIFKAGLSLLLVSVAAQLGTLPLTAAYFNRIPLFSMGLNLIAIPFAGLFVALGLTSLLLAPLNLATASFYNSLNQELLSGFIRVMHFLGNLPTSSVHIASPHPLTILSYFSVLVCLFNIQNPKRLKNLILLSLTILNITVWNGVFHNDSGKVKWIQFDVGQGDAALLRLPRGKTILIDGGQKRPHFDNGERVIAPYLRRSGIKKLDAVILTHPHSDHLGGLLYILNHFQIGKVITGGSEYDSKIHTDFQEIIQKKKISHRMVTAPDSLIEFPGVKLYFLSPTEKRKSMVSNLNNQSLVLGLYYGELKIFFMGDAEKEVEEEMIRLYENLDCDLIKAGHHGSFTSNTQSFLKKVTPEEAVISVGATNRFRHPSESCLNRFKQKDIGIHRTDIEGAVIFQTDGRKIEKIRWR